MALTLRRPFVAARSGTLRVSLCLFVCLAAVGAAMARAEDPAERAAQIRDEILARRRVQSERAAQVQADQARNSLQRAGDETRARLDRSRTDLAAANELLGRMRAQHERLVTQLAELDAAAQRERAVRRARVAALYRAADLGAGAAGWRSDISARSVRLARYLVAAAAPSGASIATLEVRRGSHIAALDRSRADQQNAADETRRLEALTVVAENELARVEEQLRAPASPLDAAAAANPIEGDVSGELAAAAAELERNAERGEASAEGADAAPANEALQAQARIDAEALAQQQARAAAEAQARIEAKARADEETKAKAQADAEALARARARAAQLREQAAASDPTVGSEHARRGGESTFDWSDQRSRTQRAAPATAAAGAQGAAGPATEAASGQVGAAAVAGGASGEPGAKPDKQGLLSRLFGGGGEEAKRFASSKGALAPPLSGRVVANFGQRHENGATYRGVIVRSSRGAPVKAVSAGTVLFAGPLAGLGDTVIVSHGGRYHSVYGRLGSVRFKVGDNVEAGDVVGTLPADDGDLHFEMREGGRAIDPLPWLRGAGDSLSR